ncbi:MAG TPA: gliding motility-associated C-terminal domain-containing protein, partial [Hymenobacter sp.]
EAPLRIHFGGVAAGAVWDFGDGSHATGAEVDHTYSGAGRYQPHVALTFNNLCRREATLPVLEVKPYQLPPNIITPNGDGLNDVFIASKACPRRLQIFSRWGNQVYEAATYQNNWDGGKQPAGVYYYLLYMADGTKLKGWLEVQR